MNFMRRFIYLFLSLSALCSGAEKIGKVTDVQGNLVAQNIEMGQRELKMGEAVYLGDTLISDDTARAQIDFTDKTTLLLIPNSSFTISDYSTSGTRRFLAKLQQGGIRVSTGLIAKKKPENFEIETPDATIGVRGTTFLARIYENDLFAGSLRGKISLRNQAGRLEIGPNQYGKAVSKNMAPESLSARPDALDPSNFTMSGPKNPGVAAMSGQMVASRFGWGPAVGALAIVGNVVGVVAASASQSQPSFSH